MKKLKTNEIKNGRLAMLAMFGYGAQAVMTGNGPFQNLCDHLASPTTANILGNFAIVVRSTWSSFHFMSSVCCAPPRLRRAHPACARSLTSTPTPFLAPPKSPPLSRCEGGPAVERRASCVQERQAGGAIARGARRQRFRWGRTVCNGRAPGKPMLQQRAPGVRPCCARARLFAPGRPPPHTRGMVAGACAVAAHPHSARVCVRLSLAGRLLRRERGSSCCLESKFSATCTVQVRGSHKPKGQAPAPTPGRPHTARGPAFGAPAWLETAPAEARSAAQQGAYAGTPHP